MVYYTLVTTEWKSGVYGWDGEGGGVNKRKSHTGIIEMKQEKGER